MSEVRLQKIIADFGICSRRKAEELILAGKVKVDGKVVNKLGSKVDLSESVVDVLGQKIGGQSKINEIYLALYKPAGYITSTSDEQGKSVLDLIKEKNYFGQSEIDFKKIAKARLYPVGRLDKDSEGLIILTNDGALANALVHPSFDHEKEYEVEIGRRLLPDDKQRLERGMRLGAERVRGIKIVSIKSRGEGRIVTVILKEGKNRQLRRMFGSLGYDLKSLKRTRMGNLILGSLPKGKWKQISKTDIL